MKNNTKPIVKMFAQGDADIDLIEKFFTAKDKLKEAKENLVIGLPALFKDVRRQKGNMTQTTLAALLGVTSSAISHIEAGATFPSVALLERFIEVAGYQTEESI